MEEFYRVVQALAQSPDVQSNLFPDFVNVADELVLDWGDVVESEYFLQIKKGFSSEQQQAISGLESYINEISGKNIDTVWTTEAIYTSEEWVRIRNLAKEVIQLMGWDLDIPAKSSAIYIAEGRVEGGNPPERE